MIARIFPRKTKASPTDPLAFYGPPGMLPQLLGLPITEVHISVAFTWDMKKAEQLADQWQQVAPVKIGGPATGEPSGEFVPGRYLKPGYTITSRGCVNHCWFCSVWKREPKLIELPICEGRNVLDDNLLACSEPHIRAVFAMLENQRRVEFTGGLEAKLLKPWHCELLSKIKPKQMFFAYDTPDDWEPLVEAARMLWQYDFTPASHAVRAYVLMGWGSDTLTDAEKRLKACCDIGIYPMAMLWRDDKGLRKKEWIHFVKTWSRPAHIAHLKLERKGNDHA